MKRQERFLYGFISLAGEVGGYVGLFLGVSFFHVVLFFKSEMETRFLLTSIKPRSGEK